ncbi:Rho-binding antiterminator [Glaciecola sp. SC05]|uniref:Rho-binding antiterminator n=1 Tax=Glaciecola sp. SC05 TaxID=1987355 RepID=UPI003526D53D
MITCKAHDYLEIACMYRLRVRLYMLNGDLIEGLALDTTRTVDNQEAILLERDHDPIKIALIGIESMESITHNSYFSKVDISRV